MPVGSSLAGRIVQLGPPLLRVRYRFGVYVTLGGYPDWEPYAAAMVGLGPVPSGRTVDEIRVLDVLAANRALARATAQGAASGAGRTPRIEAPGRPVRFRAVRTVAEEALVRFENWLGGPLPESYRGHLRATNGGLPTEPAVLPTAGFVADQPLFGLAAEDRAHDLGYVNTVLHDRFTPDLLAIGHVQGGLLALKVGGADRGSVWYWDDDDPRDDERYEAPVICRDLLVRCADDFDAFLGALTVVPPSLLDLVDESAELVVPEGMGSALPRSRRPAWLDTLTSAAPGERRAAPS
ncbi:MAG: hypothetical protein AUI10_09740 [Actinobacteria bacterium 13_2_20CM_2_72_6]|nr:MAG: hypothetical protein AUI10_09740 [Actinobacteria bacterium 13_2_20CM_2_72_6]